MGFLIFLITINVTELKIDKLREFRIFGRFRKNLENWVSYRPSNYVTQDKKLITLQIEKETIQIISIPLFNNKEHKIIGSFQRPNIFSLSGFDNRIIALGGHNLKQIFVFDTLGNMIEEFLLDFHTLPTMAKIINETLLIVSGRSLDYGIELYNLKSGDLIRKFFKIPSKVKDLIKRGRNSIIFQVGFDITPKGNLIVSTSVEPYIYEYDIYGKLLFIYKEYPQNYISLKEVSPFDIDEKEEFKDKIKEKLERWIKSWTIKGVPMMFNKNYFLIQRNWYPPYYIDFYSISERKYIGSIKTDYVLLYAMPNQNLFYLVETVKESLLIIGEYEIKIDNKDLNLKFEDDINITFLPILKEGVLNLLMVATPFDCGFYNLLEEVKSLKNINYNFLILVSHNNLKALSKYCFRLEKNLNQKVIPVLNLVHYLRKKEIIQATPVLLIFDENRKFVTKYDFYSKASLKEFLSFLHKPILKLKSQEMK
ncbi:MAG: hypothetical protein NZ608_07315 [candidate division WOR-3 bacterium]|nr:hypothetical protein [candidate division WOR-3 bacterium]